MAWTIRHSLLGTLVAITAAASQARATFQYDLRFAPDQSGEVDPHNVTLDPSSPSTYTLQLWGQISGDTNLTNDAWNSGYVSLESEQGANPAFTTGGVTSANLGLHISANSSPGHPLYTLGAAANITNDGLSDWGSGDTSATTGWTLWSGGHPPGYFDGVSDTESEQVNANTWEVLIVTYTISVGSISTDGGSTSFVLLAPLQIKNGAFIQPSSMVYYQDETIDPITGGYFGKNDSFSIIGNVTFSTFADSGSSLSPDSLTIPEPASLTLLALGGLTLLNRRRRLT